MKQQNNSLTIKITVVILALLVIGWLIYASSMKTGPAQSASTGVSVSATTSIPVMNTTGWQTISSSTTGVTFLYPAELGTNYIQTVDWPPYMSVNNGPFSCSPTGTEIDPEGKTSEETINGSTYCVTIEAEGAAGSIYTAYAYAFQKDGKIMTLNFTLRQPQCVNYDDPQMTACKNEESAFDVNTLADAMAQSASYRAPASATQTGTPPSNSAVKLNSVSPGTGPVGTTIILTGSGFTADNKVLFNGNVAAADAHPSSSVNAGQTITINVPGSMGPDCKPDEACPQYMILVTPNTYSVTVENINGISNSVSFTVTE